MREPIKTGILCVPEYDDVAVIAVRRLLARSGLGAVVLLDQGVGSQRNLVEDVLRRWCDEEELDLVLTIGGTLPAPGPSGREIVPEATLAVAERLLPGLPETMRAIAQEESPLALLDRGVAAIRGRTLLLNLPEGAAPALLFLQSVVDVIAPVIAHLRDDPAAPRLVDEVELGDEGAQPAPAPLVQPGMPGHGRQELDANEFAAFLRHGAGTPET